MNTKYVILRQIKGKITQKVGSLSNQLLLL